jgi:putative component of toxin-antitoxin plasmid stabilization module
MNTFTLEKEEKVRGRIDFYYLIIDGKNQFKEFENQAIKDGNFKSELNTIQARMQEMAEMRHPMPKTKCRDITPKGETVKEYEIKTKHYRVYLIHEPDSGRVIILAGKKTGQAKDIKKFRRIKRDYIHFKESC